ncbi:hypothetical protein F1559_004565 [Cyanidiococcus yangmingshanensis]|uniref:Uncharacterized protein n=1 Tax=Cyanidiococcus yangmingshanensis TaxID=2690220 RepID=A0A7J7ILH0_9RHOD|nr:hypothetical protein F1559_004565 [Cyanidiococcus yangmingshanensis]
MPSMDYGHHKHTSSSTYALFSITSSNDQDMCRTLKSHIIDSSAARAPTALFVWNCQSAAALAGLGCGHTGRPRPVVAWFHSMHFRFRPQTVTEAFLQRMATGYRAYCP